MLENSGTEALNSELGLHKKGNRQCPGQSRIAAVSVVAVVTQALLLQVW